MSDSLETILAVRCAHCGQARFRWHEANAALSTKLLVRGVRFRLDAASWQELARSTARVLVVSGGKQTVVDEPITDMDSDDLHYFWTLLGLAVVSLPEQPVEASIVGDLGGIVVTHPELLAAEIFTVEEFDAIHTGKEGAW